MPLDKSRAFAIELRHSGRLLQSNAAEKAARKRKVQAKSFLYWRKFKRRA